MTLLRGLITPLITTHEPPRSRGWRVPWENLGSMASSSLRESSCSAKLEGYHTGPAPSTSTQARRTCWGLRLCEIFGDSEVQGPEFDPGLAHVP